MLLGMKKKTALLAITIMASTTAPLGAYDGLQGDMTTCMEGTAKASSEQVVAACSRLIDNAQAENELIGFAYAMRAVSNNNKASNCRDAQKAAQLVKAPKAAESIKQLIQSNC